MGFDDMELAAFSEPPLTTITVDKLAIGKKAAELAAIPYLRMASACRMPWLRSATGLSCSVFLMW
jgi:hypothetical protein